MPLEAFYCLYAVLAYSYFIDRFASKSLQERLWAVGISFIVINSMAIFYKIFISYGLLDPISFHLFRIEKFIPY